MKTSLKQCDLRSNTRAIAPDVTHSDYKEASNPPGTDWDQRRVTFERFDTVIHKGRVRFTRSGEGWTSKVYENPTVADALMAMQTSMMDLKDMHHAFFEGLSDAKVAPEGPCKSCGHEADGEIALIAIYTGS